jgi:hypothetical protein
MILANFTFSTRLKRFFTLPSVFIFLIPLILYINRNNSKPVLRTSKQCKNVFYKIQFYKNSTGWGTEPGRKYGEVGLTVMEGGGGELASPLL